MSIPSGFLLLWLPTFMLIILSVIAILLLERASFEEGRQFPMLSHYVAREPFQTESIAETLGESIGIDLPSRSARRQSGLQFASSIIET